MADKRREEREQREKVGREKDERRGTGIEIKKK